MSVGDEDAEGEEDVEEGAEEAETEDQSLYCFCQRQSYGEVSSALSVMRRLRSARSERRTGQGAPLRAGPCGARSIAFAPDAPSADRRNRSAQLIHSPACKPLARCLRNLYLPLADTHIIDDWM
jgi:hypothetical protein